MKTVVLQIDKSGTDIFDKDYSIAIVKDYSSCYGINIPQSIKDKIMSEFNQGRLGKFTSHQKVRLKLRFHSAVIINLILSIVPQTDLQLSLQICNDYDGHFHEIKQMIFDNLKHKYSYLILDAIVQTKFHKPSAVDTTAKNLRDKINTGINVIHLNEKMLLDFIRK
jgi:hypothetical protein